MAANVSSTQVLESVAERHGSPVYRAKVGEPFVVALVQEIGVSIGGEGNGGVIFPAVQPGRDSLSGAMLVLDLLSREGKTLSEMVATYPPAFMVKDRIPSEPGMWKRLSSGAKDWWPEARVDELDGLKWIWADRWLQLRPSNTEPILRIMAEAGSSEEARRLVESVKARILFLLFPFGNASAARYGDSVWF